MSVRVSEASAQSSYLSVKLMTADEVTDWLYPNFEADPDNLHLVIGMDDVWVISGTRDELASVALRMAMVIRGYQ